MTNNHRPWNFAAGPAQLPLEVLQAIQTELLDFEGTGISILEIGHRTPTFVALLERAQQLLRQLMGLSKGYRILFVAGGARLINDLIPLNLNTTGDYVITGHWSKTSYQQALKYGDMQVAASNQQNNQGYPASHWGIDATQWTLHDHTEYVHYCHNETLNGLAFPDIPVVSKPVCIDMTSCFLSQPATWHNAHLIYAGAQKNLGIAGLSLVVIHQDLLGHAHPHCPDLGNFTLLDQYNSLLNTPTVFAIYVLYKMLKFVQSQWGLAVVGERNQHKAQLLYQYIDQSDFYHNHVQPEWRSWMNVSFHLSYPERQDDFLQQAQAQGLVSLKGHSVVGGLRASLYNGMPVQGVQDLIAFMQDYERRYG